MFFIISLRSILIKESRTHGTRLGSIINVSVYMLLQLVNLITGKGDLTQRTVELGSSWFSSSTHAVRGWSPKIKFSSTKKLSSFDIDIPGHKFRDASWTNIIRNQWDWQRNIWNPTLRFCSSVSVSNWSLNNWVKQ